MLAKGPIIYLDFGYIAKMHFSSSANHIPAKKKKYKTTNL